jgi:L-cystine uptake protein TcyP (sodium:dicarboxylate symporter family)
MRWFGGLFFGVLVLFVFGYTAYKTLYKKKSLSKLEKIVVFVLIFFSLIPSLIGLLEGLTSP